MHTKDAALATRVLHAGEGADPSAAPLTTPIYETSTFVFESAAEMEEYVKGRSGKYLYTRYANPTLRAVEAKLAALEGAEEALVFSSGMAATSTTLLGLLRSGDELVCSAAVYGGTLHLASDLLPRCGIDARVVALDALARPDDVLTDRTRLLWFESPANPALRCVDIRTIASACRARGVISVIDNTFATPVNQQPLALGVDIAMHSATKYLNGHSDLTAGAIMGARERLADVERARRQLGTVLDPAAGAVLARSLKTLHLRVARHNASALAVAAFLDRDPRVSRTRYPGLPSDPDHDIARRQMSGFGGMVAFELPGGYEAACRFYDRLRVVRRAASLGGVESLCSLPVLTSHVGYSPEALARAGITTGTVRLSVGLEDVDDLIADVDQALG
jgi:cystathionine beta-lyase/cystathionine gamma-synthase